MAPRNNEFTQVHNKFTEYGWRLITNTDEELVYSHDINMNDEFKIQMGAGSISVCAPIALGNYSYKVKMDNSFDASEHIIKHLIEFEEKTHMRLYNLDNPE